MVIKNPPEYLPEPPPKDAPDSGAGTHKHDMKITDPPKKPPKDSKMGTDAAHSLQDTDGPESIKPY